MSYTITNSRGQVVAVIEDGTINTGATDLTLIGSNYTFYGAPQNENFVYLLENFASATQPPRPVSGQIWYDSGSSKLKFYDGTKFRTTGGAEISATAPTGLTVGDFWFDTANKQLYSWNGNDFTLIGPQGVAGSGTTQMISRSVKEQGSSTTHAIIEARVGTGTGTYQTVFVISPDAAFDLDAGTNPITGFTTVRPGITLATLVGSQVPLFQGTATNSQLLNSLSSSQFMRSDANTSTTGTLSVLNNTTLNYVNVVSLLMNSKNTKHNFKNINNK